MIDAPTQGFFGACFSRSNIPCIKVYSVEVAAVV